MVHKQQLLPFIRFRSQNENFFNLHSEQIELIIRFHIFFLCDRFSIQEEKIKVGSRKKRSEINCIFHSENVAIISDF